MALPLPSCDLGEAPSLEKHGFGPGTFAGLTLTHYPVCAEHYVLFISQHRPPGLTVLVFRHHPYPPAAHGGIARLGIRPQGTRWLSDGAGLEAGQTDFKAHRCPRRLLTSLS